MKKIIHICLVMAGILVLTHCGAAPQIPEENENSPVVNHDDGGADSFQPPPGESANPPAPVPPPPPVEPDSVDMDEIM